MIALCALVLGLLEIFCGSEKNPPVKHSVAELQWPLTYHWCT